MGNVTSPSYPNHREPSPTGLTADDLNPAIKKRSRNILDYLPPSTWRRFHYSWNYLLWGAVSSGNGYKCMSTIWMRKLCVCCFLPSKGCYA